MVFLEDEPYDTLVGLEPPEYLGPLVGLELLDVLQLAVGQGFQAVVDVVGVVVGVVVVVVGVVVHVVGHAPRLPSVAVDLVVVQVVEAQDGAAVLQ